MIKLAKMGITDVEQLQMIDRSEHIDLVYEMNDGQIIEIIANHECPNWDEALLLEIKERFLIELTHGGLGIGAYNHEQLVGFGVLAHKFRGDNKDRLQVDLMYVSRNYRRQGIGSRIIEELKKEARNRGARQLYISSTETNSAVSFYKSKGSKITADIDEELFLKEPKDIHMIIDL